MIFSLFLFLLLFVAIASMATAQTLYSYIAQSETDKCPDSPKIRLVYRINIEKQLVSVNAQLIKGANESQNMFLDKCVVVDHKNWRCGGDVTDLGQQVSMVGGSTVATNGRISEESLHLTRNGGNRIYIDGKKRCNYEKTLLGYRLVN